MQHWKPHKHAGTTGGTTTWTQDARLFWKVAGSENVDVKRFPNGFGAGTDVQPVVDAAHVEANGVDAQSQFLGAALVEVTLRQKLQDAHLARRKIEVHLGATLRAISGDIGAPLV